MTSTREPSASGRARAARHGAGRDGDRRRRGAVTRTAAALAVLACATLAPPATPDSRAAGPLDGLGPALASLDPAVAAAAAPALAEWIRRSRDAAIEADAAPIPDDVRAALAGHVPADVLEAVRWCRACGGASTLQHSAVVVARAPAVTVDDVIVFASTGVDIDDPALWAHELYHVMQYREWGVAGFAERYLNDRGAVEHAANEFRWRWMKRTGDDRTRAARAR